MKPIWRAVVFALLACAGGAAGAQSNECPDETDTPSLLDYAVDRAYGAWRKTPTALPPVCLYTAIAKEPLVHTDSAVLQTLLLSDETLKRTPDEPATLAARLVLLSRVGRFNDALATFERLSAVDAAHTTLPAYKLAVAAAMRISDTASLRKYLGQATAKFPSATQLAADYRILQQLPRLRALADTVRATLKKEPKLIEGYSSLTSIYGSLNKADSALMYARMALAHGVSRQSVGTALESLLGVSLRRGQLLADPDLWEATIPLAFAIDSVVSTSASKYLVALSISETVADRTRLASSISSGVFVDSRTGLTRQVVKDGSTPIFKVLTCEKLTDMASQLDVASQYLDRGGAEFAPQTIPGMRQGIARMKAVIASLRPLCSK